jgi:hypothetical protein
MRKIETLTVREIFGQKFQRDGASQLQVFSLVDHTHSPAAEHLQNSIVRYGLADHE